MRFKLIFPQVLIVSLFITTHFAHAVSTADVAQVKLVSKIEVQGNRIIDEAAVKLRVTSMPGEPVNAAKVDNDIKELYKTGYFENVEAREGYRSNEPGKVLVFVVSERPTIRNVYLEGNKAVSDESFKDKMGGSIRRFYDEKKIRKGVEEVIKSYHEKGYREAKVDYNAKPVSDEEGPQVDVTFDFNEGRETLIREVAFEGNSNISTSELRKLVETTRYKWWSSWLFGTGVVQKDLLARDAGAIHEYYMTKGHVNVRVTEPEVQETANGLKVVFKIEEGPVFKVRSVKASGTLLDDDMEKTLEGTELKPGDIFDVSLMRKDVFTINDKFGGIGYAFSNVVPEPDINSETETIDLNYIVDKGHENYINRINVSGNKKTRDNVLRRNLKIHDGDKYSSTKLERSRTLIERTGYFEEVTLNTEPSVYDDAVDVSIDVKEGRTGSFNVGAGVSTLDGLILMTRLSESNVMGTGNNIDLSVDTGNYSKTYSAAFSNPRINDTYLSGGIDLFITDRKYDDFDVDRRGGILSFGYPVWFLGEEHIDDVRFHVDYELTKIDIYNVSSSAAGLVHDQKGRSTNSSITPSIIRNTINNPLDPTSGSRQQVSFEYAGLGGDQKFWLLGLSNTMYFPLTDSHKLVFAHRIRADYGDTYSGDQKFPLFKRFFPGGINTVRGYRGRQLGPRDINSREYGGDKQLVTNFEIIFPIFTDVGLKGVLFYDAGQAFDDDQSIRVDKLKHAWGFGIRWRTPMAPIRLEFGFPINHGEYGSGGMVVNFSLGMPE